MFVFQVHHFIKPEFVDVYKETVLVNARKTVQEPGIVRFDVLQDSEAPTRFSLFEVYRDKAAQAAHLETEHFLAWKDLVLGQEMFAPKGHGYEFEAVFPDEAEWG